MNGSLVYLSITHGYDFNPLTTQFDSNTKNFQNMLQTLHKFSLGLCISVHIQNCVETTASHDCVYKDDKIFSRNWKAY